ncbi:beta-1,6-N-acetylglucosaminyltransferase [Rhodobacteraceae bacterium]|nr:beta-1,6-N-acetylglucosaminyltransferase [Paracoccaceae bacterium]
MARIAFILLTHKDPEAIIRQAARLTAAGDFVSIHFDARAKPADFQKIRDGLGSNPSVCFSKKRLKCGWGEWSLVAATLEAVSAAVDAFPDASHFYMLSGDCMQIKTSEYAHDFLDRNECDFIESFDFFSSDWIQTGFKEERLIYRHWFNERTQKWLFYQSYEWQKRFGFTREVPDDIEMMIGSQWWCLRRDTVEKVLQFCKDRPDVMRFFRTTWIPDETFFQTVVRHVVADREIKTRTLTFLMFTDYGMPLTFYNDHYDLLLAQDYLFARKISPEAKELKARLGRLWGETGVHFPISDEGRSLFKFLTGKGREGHRFAPRFWETESSLGRERVLYVVVCKKWHVAKRLVERIHQNMELKTANYLFHEDEPLPELGGIERTMGKRNRHRRALLRMLFDYHQTDSLLICVDPAGFDIIQDFTSDKVETRILEIDTEFSDDYLIGHAQRVGLAGAETPAEVYERILPTIRYDMRFESERLRDAQFPLLWRVREVHSPQENAEPLSEFLKVDKNFAEFLAETPHFFAD